MFDDEMLTIEDLAGYLKLKPQTIYKWAQTGKIPGAKFGKEWRFRRSKIEEWIDDRMAGEKGRKDGVDLKRQDGLAGDGPPDDRSNDATSSEESDSSAASSDKPWKKGGGRASNSGADYN